MINVASKESATIDAVNKNVRLIQKASKGPDILSLKKNSGLTLDNVGDFEIYAKDSSVLIDVKIGAELTVNVRDVWLQADLNGVLSNYTILYANSGAKQILMLKKILLLLSMRRRLARVVHQIAMLLMLMR